MRRVWVFWLGLLFGSSIWAAGITVSLDAAQIEVGQQVRLTLTYDPHNASGNPDLSDLYKDFNILATERSMSYTVINGQARSIGQWGIVLEPKHPGLITIPVLRIGSLTSDPLQLNVSPAAVHAASTSQANLPNTDSAQASTLAVTVDNPNPYLNQQILYKVTLLTHQPLLDVRYQPPEVEDAILLPLGESRPYQITRKGVVYQADEQTYAIFPQKSGPLVIHPPRLQALHYAMTPQSVSLRGEPVTVQVQPLPKQFSRREWLPSKLVRLQETYDQAATQFKEGATIVRTIELQAQGLVAQLLPDLIFPDSSDLRIYPEPAERDTRMQQGELWGRVKVKLTYVFPKPGTVSLPAVRVPWFNVKTQKQEIAELPAKSYTIIATHLSKPPKSAVTKPRKKFAVFAKTHTPHAPAWRVKPITIFWGGVVLAVIVCAWILGRWWRQTTNPRRVLRKACQANDIERIKWALVAWARQQWPDKDVIHFTDILPWLPAHSALYKALHAFMAYLYHPNHHKNWNGMDLWRAIIAFKQQPKARRKRGSTVPSMYPSRK